MKKLFLILVFYTASTYCFAQELLKPQPQAKFVTRFPFSQYSGGVMIVHALLNDIPDTLNFILDTGSGGISLDSATCAFYNVKSSFSDTVVTGMGSAHKVKFAYDQKLHLPGLSLTDVDFHINNYEVLTSVYGEKIDGIIGYSFLKNTLLK